ncbi:MAG TPA: response regulator transcription factor [Candidatus Mediterraneibacter stercoripullorum]|nr:response regulator transcription factor [Candidatus Mediterraneibacter stercoripullorum]
MGGNESEKKILIVEDEPYLRRQIRDLLTQKGYIAETAASRAEAVSRILNEDDISLYLLDVWLPDGDGFELCSMIRTKNLRPVIFLTACDDEESVVRGLETGGDDYIVKPFRTAELLARIRANLRRRDDRTAAAVWSCGDIRVVLDANEVYKGEEKLNLSAVEYKLLLALMENGERIVRRETLMEYLWDRWGQEIEDNTLSVTISRLRRKIGAEYIETIRGFGYRLKGPVGKALA